MTELRQPSWMPTRQPDFLRNGQVDLWKIHFKGFHPVAAELAQDLSPDELERGRRFAFDKDRLDFLVGRSILRSLLSGYLGIAPRDVRIETGHRGKPGLSQCAQNKGIKFNLSHSYGLAVVAFRTGGEIGVDVEKLRQEITILDIAERYFASKETAWLRAQPADRQLVEFCSLWTRKEALSKALGEGLHLPLDQITLEALTDQAMVVSATNDDSGGSRWRLSTFVPAKGYVGSLATEGEEELKVRY